MRELSASQLIEHLKLSPHPAEGGFYRETYRSGLAIPQRVLPPGYTGSRSAGTAIYYLLTPDSCSAMHRLRGDELFHFYLGDPVEMLRLNPDGSGDVVVLGQDLVAGMTLQVTVRSGVWQGSKLREGGRFALLGTTMAPGFDFEDYEHASRGELVKAFPAFQSMIIALTPATGNGGAG